MKWLNLMLYVVDYRYLVEVMAQLTVENALKVSYHISQVLSHSTRTVRFQGQTVELELNLLLHRQSEVIV